MTVQIRPFTEHDYAGLIAVQNAAYPDYPDTLDDMRHYDAARDPKCFWMRVVAERDGMIVGYVGYHNVSFMYHPQKFWLEFRERRRPGDWETMRGCCSVPCPARERAGYPDEGRLRGLPARPPCAAFVYPARPFRGRAAVSGDVSAALGDNGFLFHIIRLYV